ncbi:MAG: DUF4230 domain-containing protein [Synechococcales cyanobacterium CRU_2_2]|nr:DUF4230 domain-containing protein [Synechococcales cyanobacterium CRU_2_2]
MLPFHHHTTSRTTHPTGEPRRSRPSDRAGSPLIRLWRSATLVATGAGVAIALVAGVGVMRLGDRFWSEVKSVFAAPQPEPQVDVRSTIVQQVRQVSELSTAVFTMEAVVPTRQERTLAGLPVGATTLLYVARGEVRAGVDLSQLQPADVVVSADQNSLEIRLPRPQILGQTIDVRESQVYDYDRGFLGLGPDVAVELQSLANQTALTKIATAACQENILGQANQRAQLVITQLMLTAGFRQVNVQTRDAIGCGEAPTNPTLTGSPPTGSLSGPPIAPLQTEPAQRP